MYPYTEPPGPAPTCMYPGKRPYVPSGNRSGRCRLSLGGGVRFPFPLHGTIHTLQETLRTVHNRHVPPPAYRLPVPDGYRVRLNGHVVFNNPFLPLRWAPVAPTCPRAYLT
ncbi:MAG TPA: hypothetical protein VK102_03340 [Sphingobacterium sp.]|nr:hypothetical protein [Sphingobacterium sp.]